MKTYSQMKAENEWNPEDGSLGENHFTLGKPDECILDSELSDIEGGLYAFTAPNGHKFGVMEFETHSALISEDELADLGVKV